jgi:hypothetical protein
MPPAPPCGAKRPSPSARRRGGATIPTRPSENDGIVKRANVFCNRKAPVPRTIPDGRSPESGSRPKPTPPRSVPRRDGLGTAERQWRKVGGGVRLCKGDVLGNSRDSTDGKPMEIRTGTSPRCAPERGLSLFYPSRTSPSSPITLRLSGMSFPDPSIALTTRLISPLQHGTSMMATVTLRTLLRERIAASFSA